MLDQDIAAYRQRRHKKTFAKKLRRQMTPQEIQLWDCLRDRRLSNCKFRRQVLIGPFIVDFLSMEHSLIIEIDGGIHEKQKEYDADREKYLQERYWKILRFRNEQIDSDIENVLMIINKFIQTEHSPSPGRRRMEGEGVRG